MVWPLSCTKFKGSHAAAGITPNSVGTAGDDKVKRGRVAARPDEGHAHRCQKCRREATMKRRAAKGKNSVTECE